MNKTTSIMLIAYTLFLVVVPFSHPNNYIFLPCLIGSTVSLVSLYLMYTFLGSAPDAQQTITNSLHIHLSIVYALYVIRETILSFLFNIMYASSKSLFESNPTVMCSLSSDRLAVIPCCTTVFLLALSKLNMFLYPLHYQGLNHKMLGKLALAVTMLLPTLDTGIRLLKHETVCNSFYLEATLIESYGLNIPKHIGQFMGFPWAPVLGVSG